MSGGNGARWRLTRSKILLAAGLGGVFHETVIAESPRPYLLVLFGAMMGLAGFARLDDLLASRGITIVLDRQPEPEPEPEPGSDP